MLRDHEALVRYLAERSRMSFTWGSEANDCASFAAGAIKAMTGRDMLAGWSRWDSERGAKVVMARRGGFEAAVDGLLTRLPSPALAARGDIAGYIGESGTLALAVVEGPTLAGPHANGVRRISRNRAIMAWSAT